MLDTLVALVALIPAGLRRVRHAVSRTWAARRPAGRAQAGPGLLPGLDPRLAPMPVVAPPAATNDNPLLAVQEAVERDLRASGHLR